MFAVRMTVLFSYWYNGFYSALQALDQTAFWHFLAIFGVLATVHVLRTLVDSYAGQAFDIHWRVWLNERLTHDWLDGRAYYRGHFLTSRRQPRPAHRAGHRVVRRRHPHAGHRRPERGGVAGGSSPPSCGACRGAGGGGRGNPARHGVHGLCVRRHRHRVRVPHRPSADPAEFPVRAPDRQLPLCVGAAARERRERGVLPGRAWSAPRCASAWPTWPICGRASTGA